MGYRRTPKKSMSQVLLLCTILVSGSVIFVEGEWADLGVAADPNYGHEMVPDEVEPIAMDTTGLGAGSSDVGGEESVKAQLTYATPGAPEDVHTASMFGNCAVDPKARDVAQPPVWTATAGAYSPAYSWSDGSPKGIKPRIRTRDGGDPYVTFGCGPSAVLHLPVLTGVCEPKLFIRSTHTATTGAYDNMCGYVKVEPLYEGKGFWAPTLASVTKQSFIDAKNSVFKHVPCGNGLMDAMVGLADQVAQDLQQQGGAGIGEYAETAVGAGDSIAVEAALTIMELSRGDYTAAATRVGTTMGCTILGAITGETISTAVGLAVSAVKFGFAMAQLAPSTKTAVPPKYEPTAAEGRAAIDASWGTCNSWVQHHVTKRWMLQCDGVVFSKEHEVPDVAVFRNSSGSYKTYVLTRVRCVGILPVVNGTNGLVVYKSTPGGISTSWDWCNWDNDWANVNTQDPWECRNRANNKCSPIGHSMDENKKFHKKCPSFNPKCRCYYSDVKETACIKGDMTPCKYYRRSPATTQYVFGNNRYLAFGTADAWVTRQVLISTLAQYGAGYLLGAPKCGTTCSGCSAQQAANCRAVGGDGDQRMATAGFSARWVPFTSSHEGGMGEHHVEGTSDFWDTSARGQMRHGLDYRVSYTLIHKAA